MRTLLSSESVHALWDRAARALTGGPPQADEAPLVRAPVPYLGHAIAFGKDSTALLRACQQRHGDVFTLLVAGRRMTFLLDARDFPAVLRAPELGFAAFADELSVKAFGHAPLADSGLADTHELHGYYNLHLKNAALTPLNQRMFARLAAALEREASDAWRTEGLYAFVDRVVFAAGVETLFGDGAATGSVARDFRRLDDAFPLLVGGVPAGLLRGVVAARRRLAAMFAVERPHTSAFMRAREEFLRTRTDPDNKNFLELSMLWASQANTIPAAFWALAYLLADPQARAAVAEEVAAAGDIVLTHETLRRMPRLQSACSEALRLSSASLTVRRAERRCTLTLHDGRAVAIREGDQVCIVPAISHRDPELFPDPDVYRFDRFLAEGGPKQFFKGGTRVPLALMPYGGGESMCPGRFLANGEIAQFVALMLKRCEVELVDARLPEFDARRGGLGVLPPAREVLFRHRRR